MRDRDGQRIALPSAVRAHAQRLEREREEEARRRAVAERERLNMEERLAAVERERAEEARQRAELEAQVRRLRELGGE